ncbi:uncharacterized protein LOC117291519 isoform X2 [Asterias rubens]|uniref:uncharacterized protein LOC117291519 isoform X2 n=1 Tax=Asterias rubens TaxID=7604 RepID=UPI001455B6E1|nr:uncharacterized protein LOC117291519 isoform X2 [Asterias rubens]
MLKSFSKGLSNILSTLDKKSALNGNSKSDEMSSLDTRATHSDSNEQPRARYQYQYEQRPLYNDNPKPKRSHSAGRYSDHSAGDDDYVRVADTRSSEQYRYESSYSGRGDQDRRGGSYHDGSQPFNSSYHHYPREEEVMVMQDAEQYWVPSSYVSPSTQSPYQPGPPKPPRRQQSLNRIHIPSGPDYDEDTRSPTEMELSSTSPESGSPKHWQTSPLVNHQQGVFAIIGSPSKPTEKASHEVGYPSQQAVQTSSAMTYNTHSQREYSQSYAKQQSYTMHERDERRSQPQYKPTPTSPQRQANITRQSSLPVSRSPQSIPRQQNVQRAASFDRKPGNTRKRDDAPRKSQTASRSPQRYSSKGKREPDLQPRRSDPKSRAPGDRQGSRSVGRPAQPGRNQQRRPPVDSRSRKITSPDRGVALIPTNTPRRGSLPDTDIERFIVPNKQAGTFASPQYQTTPMKPVSTPTSAKQGGIGALLISDKDHEAVNIDSVSWLLENRNFSKTEYVSDSGVSSIRDGSLGPQAHTFVAPVQAALTTSMDYSYPSKTQAHFPEETAQYRLYGDGPLEYPSYGNDKEKMLFSKPVSLEKRQQEDYYSKPSPSSYYSSPADKQLQEPISRRDQRRPLLRSTSQESSEHDRKTPKDQEQKRQHFPQTDTVDPRVGSSLYYPPSQQKSTRNSSQHQDSPSNRSPKKALFKEDHPNLAQYRAEEVKPLVDAGHYDYPKKYYPVQDSPTSGSSYDQHDPYSRQVANGQRIKASPNRYNKKMVEADRMGIEPAMDGGEAYWGMELRKPPPNRLNHSQRTPEQVSEHRSTPEASIGQRKEASVYYSRDTTQVTSSSSSRTFQESEIKRQLESLNPTSPPAERQSRYDRLKQRAAGQQTSQKSSAVKSMQPRSKSLSRLDTRGKVPQSSEISLNKDTLSKSTDDLDDLRKQGFSRGAALFMRMMRQASMEEEDYELRSIGPVAVDSYVGTPKLFQPQITKTGEPILDLASPGSDSFGGGPPSMEEEPLLTMKVQHKVESAPPRGKASEHGQVPPKKKASEFEEVPTTHWRDRVQTERQYEQNQTKEQRNGIADTKPIQSPDGPPSPVVITRHGNQEVPVEWLLKQEGLRRTPAGGKRSASPSKYSHLTDRSPSPTKRTPLVEKSLSFTETEEVFERTSAAKQSSSPAGDKRSATPSKYSRLTERSPSPNKRTPLVERSRSFTNAEEVFQHTAVAKESSTPAAGKRSASPSKYSQLTERSSSPSKRTPLVEKSLSFTKAEEVFERTSVAKQLSSPKKQELNQTSSVEKSVSRYTRQDAVNRTPSQKQVFSPVKQGLKGTSSDEKPIVSATKQEGTSRTSFSEKSNIALTRRSPSPIKLKSPDSEPIPLSRRGKQDVPSEWLKVLDRLHGKPKERSSDGGLPASKNKPEKSNRVSADFEDALSELEHMYSILDEEADDLMFHKSRRPFDQRISELPPALQKRLKDLKEYAIAQRNKRQVRRERAKSDITAKTPALVSHKPAAEVKKNQEFVSYRQSLNSTPKLSKPTTLDLPNKTTDLRHRVGAARTERSSSDEETSPQQRNSAQLYRQPRSADNLGFSSDSSPSPDRNRKNFAARFEAASKKPESRFEKVTGLVLPEYVPSHTRQVEKTPVKAQSPQKKVAPKQVQEVISKTAAVDVRASRSIFEKLDPGSRMSMDSVSTVDSYQLSQPFEEISAEYQKMSSDHRMDIGSDDDVSPGQRSSSSESLVQSVANSGNGLKRTSKQKVEPSAGGELRTGEKTKSTGTGPVPLASFDEEIAKSLHTPDSIQTNEGPIKEVSKQHQRPSAFADILHLLSWIDSTDI